MISSIIRAAMRRKPCPSSELIIRGWNNTGSEGGFHERLPRKGPRRHVISGRKPEDHGAGSWNRGRDQGVGRQRKIRSHRNPMGRRAILRLAQPLSPVEYDLRPDGRKPHRFRSDSLHLHPLLPSPSARNGGKHGLTPANRFLVMRHRFGAGTPRQAAATTHLFFSGYSIEVIIFLRLSFPQAPRREHRLEPRWLCLIDPHYLQSKI